MSDKLDLMETVKGFIEKRGRVAVDRAREDILSSKYDGGAVSSAMKYFAEFTIQGSMPVFPALISLSCEAVGGKTEKVPSVGAALILMAAAADIHDDVIDHSITKYSKKTVFGKFGLEVALLAGDALIVQGVNLVNRAIDSLSPKDKEIIRGLLLEAFFDITKAEAKEVLLRRKLNISPQEYFEVINLKAAVPEVHCKIGAILGNANDKEVQFLGCYGKSFGLVSLIRDEFIDLLEYPEFLSRVKNECLPLPVLFAMQDKTINEKLELLMGNAHLKKKDVAELACLVLSSRQVNDLKTRTNRTVKEGLDSITFIKNALLSKELETLLMATSSGF
jgi:geranylgeranyl pyrophosphate synthase